jgi:hypothetical protein
MGTDKLAFEWQQWEATGSDVSHVTGSDPVRTILCAYQPLVMKDNDIH